MNDFPDMMTPAQAALFLQYSRKNIYLRLQAGTLPGFRVGRGWRIPKSELIAMARENLTRGQDIMNRSRSRAGRPRKKTAEDTEE